MRLRELLARVQAQGLGRTTGQPYVGAGKLGYALAQATRSERRPPAVKESSLYTRVPR